MQFIKHIMYYSGLDTMTALKSNVGQITIRRNTMTYDEKPMDMMNYGTQRFDISPVTCPGYASVVPQMMRDTYNDDDALRRGTVFPELDLPYGKYGYECGR